MLNEQKIDYLVYFRKPINDPRQINNFHLEQSAEYRFNLFEKKEYFDILNKDFAKGIKAKEIVKYKDFYMSSYNGMKGLKDYSLRQDIFIKAKAKEADRTLKNRLYKHTFFVPSDSLSYKGTLIDKKVIFPNFISAENDSYNICDYKKGNNKLCFSGYYKTKTGNIKGFTAISENFKDIIKVNNSQKSDTSTIVNLLVEEFSTGVYTIETSIGSGIKNTLIKYDNKGKLLIKKVLSFSKIPRYMTYDDINNSIIIVFYGNNLNSVADADNEQIFYHLNLDNDEESYVVTFTAKTYIFDIIKLNEKILVFSNFINYIGIDNKFVSSEAGSLSKETNLLVTVISNGKVERHVAFTNKNPFFGVKAIKINSNLMNILGYKTTYKNKNFRSLKNADLYNLLLNSDLENVNSAWHD